MCIMFCLAGGAPDFLVAHLFIGELPSNFFNTCLGCSKKSFASNTLSYLLYAGVTLAGGKRASDVWPDLTTFISVVSVRFLFTNTLITPREITKLGTKLPIFNYMCRYRARCRPGI